MTAKWTNWAATYSCAPSRIERPSTEAELVTIVKEAIVAGETVKAIGAGHSFTDIACTSGRLIRLDGCSRILQVDKEAKTVTVEAGITLEKLNTELAAHGLA